MCRVIITEPTGVGNVGDVVDVSPGLAEHLLFPMRKAVEATPDKLESLARVKVMSNRSLLDDINSLGLAEFESETQAGIEYCHWKGLTPLLGEVDIRAHVGKANAAPNCIALYFDTNGLEEQYLQQKAQCFCISVMECLNTLRDWFSECGIDYVAPKQLSLDVA